MNSEFDYFVVTFDQVKSELEQLERKLARRHGIRKQIHQTLVRRIHSGAIEEDDLVCQWHALYCSYLEWEWARAEELPPLSDTPLSQKDIYVFQNNKFRRKPS